MATSTSTTPLRVGFVPEHFSTPLHFTILHNLLPSDLKLDLIPFPSGTGHMITSLQSHSIDIAIGLTEGFVAGLAQGKDWYRIIGGYVETPLRWALSTGGNRKEEFEEGKGGLARLKGGKLGVSRIGSGSYVMGYVLAEREGWLDAEQGKGKKPFEFVVLNDFKGLRDAVNIGSADAFLWEYFTTKTFYDTNELHQLGEIYTPWPSWHIVAHTSLLPLSPSPTTLPPSTASPSPLPPTATTRVTIDPRIPAFLTALNKGIAYFNSHPDEAVEFISTSKEMRYSAEDAREWMKTVKFVEDTRKVKGEVVDGCVGVLERAGVVQSGEGVQAVDMVLSVTEA